MYKDNPKNQTLAAKIKRVLVNYLKTQFVLMVVVFIAVYIVLAVLDVKYALLLAIFTGVLSLVPNYGMVVSSLTTALVAIFDNSAFLPNMHSAFEGLAVIVILFVLNKLADTFLSPLLLSKQSKINPLLIFVIVIIGTFLFGFIGALLAVPAVLVIKTVLEHYKIKSPLS